MADADPRGTQGTITALQTGAGLDAKIELTGRKIAQIAAGGALEIGVLALIFDSTITLKIATVVVALLILIVVQFERHLTALRANSFIPTISILILIYLCFVGYALVHAVERERIETKLREIYVAGNVLLERKVPPSEPNSYTFDEKELEQWKSDAVLWEVGTAHWIATNIGLSAKSRFADMSNLTNLCWSPRDDGCDQKSRFMNRILVEEKNLSALIEQLAVYWPMLENFGAMPRSGRSWQNGKPGQSTPSSLRLQRS